MADFDTDTISQLLEAINSSAKKNNDAARDYSSQTEELESIMESLKDPLDYEVGDIVVWKKHLKNRRLPEYGQPAIVLEIREQPLYEENAVSSVYYEEPLDVRLGFLDDEDDFVSFLFDSKKFRKVPKEES